MSTDAGPDLIDLVAIRPGKYLARVAADAFARMDAAALADGIELIVNTAHRSRAYQMALRRRYEVQLANWERDGKKGKRPAPAARPGTSKHELGLAVDLNRAHDDGEDGKLDGTGPTDRWLAARAGEFGFRRTVASEAWHWEFVGPDAAPLVA